MNEADDTFTHTQRQKKQEWTAERRRKKLLAALFQFKLDGIGPGDNRPSTDKLHHFVKKKIII